jgi:hypothetical protein
MEDNSRSVIYLEAASEGDSSLTHREHHLTYFKSITHGIASAA